MKTIFGVLLFSLSVSATSLAQNRTRARQAVPIPGAGVGLAGGGGAGAHGAAFEENITLSLKGVFPPDQTINVTFRGCGAQFRSEIVTSMVEIGGAQIPVLATLDFLVAEDDGKFVVTYTISARRPIPTSTVVGGGRKDSEERVHRFPRRRSQRVGQVPSGGAGGDFQNGRQVA